MGRPCQITRGAAKRQPGVRLGSYRFALYYAPRPTSLVVALFWPLACAHRTHLAHSSHPAPKPSPTKPGLGASTFLAPSHHFSRTYLPGDLCPLEALPKQRVHRLQRQCPPGSPQPLRRRSRKVSDSSSLQRALAPTVRGAGSMSPAAQRPALPRRQSRPRSPCMTTVYTLLGGAPDVLVQKGSHISIKLMASEANGQSGLTAGLGLMSRAVGVSVARVGVGDGGGRAARQSRVWRSLDSPRALPS